MKKLTGHTCPWGGQSAVVREHHPHRDRQHDQAAAPAMATPGCRVSRRAVAAGPMSSAVESTEPMVTAESDTVSASTRRYTRPTDRTEMPRAAAISGLIEESSWTR